jgi:hypothetical protein
MRHVVYLTTDAMPSSLYPVWVPGEAARTLYRRPRAPHSVNWQLGPREREANVPGHHLSFSMCVFLELWTDCAVTSPAGRRETLSEGSCSYTGRRRVAVQPLRGLPDSRNVHIGARYR